VKSSVSWILYAPSGRRRRINHNIEVILMAGSGSCHKNALDFKRKHGKNITHNTVAKLTEKFKKIGSVTEQPRSGHPRTSTDVVLGAFARSPQETT
jgi:hypothetical protein